jgi:hypothetical protein
MAVKSSALMNALGYGVMPPERQEPYQQQCMKKAANIYLRLWKIVTAAKKARWPLAKVGKKES